MALFSTLAVQPVSVKGLRACNPGAPNDSHCIIHPVKTNPEFHVLLHKNVVWTRVQVGEDGRVSQFMKVKLSVSASSARENGLREVRRKNRIDHHY